MGGDTYAPSREEDIAVVKEELRRMFMKLSSGDEEDLIAQLDKGSVVSGGSKGLNFGEFPDVSRPVSWISEAAERQKCKVYAEILRSYEEMQSRIEKLEEAKKKVLSYTPGSRVEKIRGGDFLDYDRPYTTSILLIGPKGSGKSSLVNKISRVFDNDMFGSVRAQVSYNSSSEEGTYFLHEYRIPKGTGCFSLYDTRGLSDDPFENMKTHKRWMKKGVHHGELVKRNTDSMDLKARLKCRARQSRSSTLSRKIHYVIFVVDALSVLKSMDENDKEKNQYSKLISTNFNNPFFSFKGPNYDKPVVVVTHGDLLSLSDRVKVRAYLGELLGIPPTTQIFDIPESNDSATTLTIVDMLNCCLERADKNLPVKSDFTAEVTYALFYIIMIIVFMFMICRSGFNESSAKVEWPAIRHLWLGKDVQ